MLRRVLGRTPNNWSLNEVSKGLLLSHNIITACAACQLWLLLIRNCPQGTERAKVQLQWVIAGLGMRRRRGMGEWSNRPGSVYPQGTERIETEPSGRVRLPGVVWTKCKAAWPSRQQPRERQQLCLCHSIQWASLAGPAAWVDEVWICPQSWVTLGKFVHLLTIQTYRVVTSASIFSNSDWWWIMSCSWVAVHHVL